MGYALAGSSEAPATASWWTLGSALQEQFDADELIVLTVAGSYAARTRSYQLLADAFALGGQA